MKTLLNRYKDRLGLTQDQIGGIEVNVTSTCSYSCWFVGLIHSCILCDTQLMKEDGISIGVTITESQNTSAGADVTILVGQMQQDVSYDMH